MKLLIVGLMVGLFGCKSDEDQARKIAVDKGGVPFICVLDYGSSFCQIGDELFICDDDKCIPMTCNNVVKIPVTAEATKP